MFTDSLGDNAKGTQDTLNKLNKKKKCYLFIWVLSLLLSLTLLFFSKLTVSDLPTLESVSLEHPLSIHLTLPRNNSEISNLKAHSSPFTDGINTGLEHFFKFFGGFLFLLSIAGLIISDNKTVFIPGTIVSSMLIASSVFVPALFDESPYEAETATDPGYVNTFSLDPYITSGNVEAFLENVSKYSGRGGAIMMFTLEKGFSSEDDVRNLKSAFSTKQAQQLTIGLAQTLAVAAYKNRAKQTLMKESLVAAGLAGRVIKATPVSDLLDFTPRTGYAIFKAAAEVEGFDLKNPFAMAVEQKVKAQKALRSFLNASSLLSFIVAVLFSFFWLCTSRYERRAANAWKEDVSERKRGWV
ncbi:hypothetical protein ACI0X9_003264 [Cronobacter turicensis]